MPKDLTGSPLARAEVEAVLEAATWAPTHHRNEPWRFTVLEGPAPIAGYLDRLDAWYAEHREEVGQEEYSKFLAKLEGARGCWPGQASHVVVVGMVRQAGPSRAAEWEEISAVACAVQNLHLALTAVPGAGGFWSSHTWCRRARDSAAMRDYLGLADPEDRVLGAFVMGRVAPGRTFRSKRAAWGEKTRWETE
jgi:nitroreductase